jgi:hypothetical protein
MATVAVTTRTGAVDRPAFYHRSGLAVTRSIATHRWHVTHVASGLALDTGFRQRSLAKDYQERLLALAIDWTLDATALKALPDIEQRVRAVQSSCPHEKESPL